MVSKKKSSKNIIKRSRIAPRFTQNQINAIDSLIGKLGASRSNAVSHTVVTGLYNWDHLDNINKTESNK